MAEAIEPKIFGFYDSGNGDRFLKTPCSRICTAAAGTSLFLWGMKIFLSMRPITFVTGNVKKLEEVTAILGSNTLFKVVRQDLDLPEYQGADPEYIVREKCLSAIRVTKGPTLVEDTCLCFNALKGLPGPYVKWFLAKIGPSGLANLLSSWEDKSAYALCLFAYSEGIDEKIFVFRGETEGIIVNPRGPQDFGWDACFQPNGSTLTYAEMEKDMKNSISHRSKALNAMKNHFSDIQMLRDKTDVSL
ncbi:Inosine triphosphate pyrophosphatase [Daphnia magna]|uniref:Inosine triphosphate pyrophosphatase n=1 Tax=Daphnia magna TaxID=35525 RepID=A0A162SFS9_9CRUS|nr:Inosine triphosphate pyrophosphatase [Daphnia magna]